MRYLKEAYSSLLIYYCTDISPFLGNLASEVLKWIAIGKLRVYNHAINQLCKLRKPIRPIGTIDTNNFFKCYSNAVQNLVKKTFRYISIRCRSSC
jgi:hypothetical protein